MRRRYPLDALEQLKKHQTVERAREKAALTAERARADRRVAEATAKTDLERSSLQCAVDRESVRVRAGRARAGDLAQSDRYRALAERRLREREGEQAKATRDLAAAVGKEQAAALVLGLAHEAEKTISRQRVRFRKEETRALERRDEEAADEAFASSSVRKRRTE